LEVQKCSLKKAHRNKLYRLLIYNDLLSLYINTTDCTVCYHAPSFELARIMFQILPKPVSGLSFLERDNV